MAQGQSLGGADPILVEWSAFRTFYTLDMRALRKHSVSQTRERKAATMGFLQRIFGKRKRTGPTALVVDDEKAIHRLLQAHLETIGFDAVAVASADDALEILEKDKRFKLFVFDIMLPGTNGISLAKKVRKIPGCTGTPILFVSGAFPPSQLERVKQEVPNSACLLKPVRRETFLETAQSLLNLAEVG